MRESNGIVRLTGLIFSIVGIILIIVGFAVLADTAGMTDNADIVEGRISGIDSNRDSDGEIHYIPFVTYKYRGQEYKNVRLKVYSSSMYEGQEIELYVDRDNPGNIRVKSMAYFVPFLLFVIGGVFAAIGIILILIFVKNKQKKRKIMAAGEKIYAQVQGSVEDTYYTVNGRHPHRLECVYTDRRSGQPVIYRSDRIWEEPEKFIGRQVTVYVDRNDRSKYAVDMNSLE